MIGRINLQKRAQATNTIDGTWNDSTGIWQHAASIGATSIVREHSIQYAQWSMATEDAIIANNPEAEKKSKQFGRGQPAQYKWETNANHSAELPVEHLIWSQPQPVARAGTDLFSTLWATIAGAVSSIASARRLDGNSDPTVGTNTQRTTRLYSNFFEYLCTASKSPLKPSLVKLELQADRWLYVLAAPFYHDDDKLDV